MDLAVPASSPFLLLHWLQRKVPQGKHTDFHHHWQCLDLFPKPSPLGKSSRRGGGANHAWLCCIIPGKEGQ